MIYGYVEDEYGERLINATVYDSICMKGTITNLYGYFSMSLNKGPIRLNASFVGFDVGEKEFVLHNDTLLKFQLKAKNQLDEIVVKSGFTNNKQGPDAHYLTTHAIERIPSIAGEQDILKSIQLLPGIQAGAEGSSALFVRGGNSGQNLILLDGVPVYNPFHLFGFFSVFNTNAIKSISVIKNGFPARYGNRLSSVVDITMKEGNYKKLKGNVDVGLIATSFFIEGPMCNKKASFIASGRRTYLELFSQPLVENFTDYRTIQYFFYDLNFKVNSKISDKSNIYLSYYTGKDKGYVKGNNSAYQKYSHNDDTNWGNSTLLLRWNYIINSKVFMYTSLSSSSFSYNLSNTDKVAGLVNTEINYKSLIKDMTSNVNIEYSPSAFYNLHTGLGYSHNHYKPGVTLYKSENGLDSVFNKSIGEDNISSNYFYSYFENKLKFTNKVHSNIGIRLSVYQAGQKTYYSAEPRFLFNYSYAKSSKLHAAYSYVKQFQHLLTSSQLNLATDLWVPCNENIEPSTAHQVSVGNTLKLFKTFDFTTDLYYKHMSGILEYKDGASYFNDPEPWDKKVESGEGWSYGAEFQLKKSTGKVNGWVSYTLSKTERQFKNINFGKIFPAKYDRTHDFCCVLNYNFSKHWNIGMTWVYYSGSLHTVADVKYDIFPSAEGINYQKNGYRLPPYHRMDVNFEYKFNVWGKQSIVSLNIYNVYNRKNIYTIRTGRMGTGKRDLIAYLYFIEKQTLFPIVPSINYSFNF